MRIITFSPQSLVDLFLTVWYALVIAQKLQNLKFTYCQIQRRGSYVSLLFIRANIKAGTPL